MMFSFQLVILLLLMCVTLFICSLIAYILPGNLYWLKMNDTKMDNINCIRYMNVDG